MKINQTFRKVKEIINEHNGNALHQIRLFLIENSVKRYIDNLTYQSFKQIGIQGDSLTLYYEYEPSIHPLLEAGQV